MRCPANDIVNLRGLREIESAHGLRMWCLCRTLNSTTVLGFRQQLRIWSGFGNKHRRAFSLCWSRALLHCRFLWSGLFRLWFCCMRLVHGRWLFSGAEESSADDNPGFVFHFQTAECDRGLLLYLHRVRGWFIIHAPVGMRCEVAF